MKKLLFVVFSLFLLLNFTTYAATRSQTNAVKAAENYLSVMPMSEKGLISQLMFDGYSDADAKYGAQNCGADWNEQAYKAAENYLSIMAFSRKGLIEQLVFDGFTLKQATYGVDQTGL